MAAIKEWCAARPRGEDKRKTFQPIIGSLRKFTVCSASTLLERFDMTMGRIGKNSLVGNMSGLRYRGFNDLVTSCLSLDRLFSHPTFDKNENSFNGPLVRCSKTYTEDQLMHRLRHISTSVDRYHAFDWHGMLARARQRRHQLDHQLC